MDAEKASLFNKDYCSVFTITSLFRNNLDENRILNNFTVTKNAVVEILGSLNVSKSGGPNNLPAVVPRNCAKELTKSILELLDKFRRLGTYPSALKIKISQAFKKKDQKQMW